MAEDEELDAEREARRRIALAQIRQYPDAALKMSARPVEEFDDELRAPRRADEAADGATRTASASPRPRSACCSGCSSSRRTRTRSSRSSTRRSSSGARRRTSTTRAASRSRACSSRSSARSTVTLAGRDENGAEVRFELEDIYARAAQHEIDHLDGVLILDRTTPEARREALAMLRPRIVLG